jgi:hypothetical protein
MANPETKSTRARRLRAAAGGSVAVIEQMPPKGRNGYVLPPT